MRQESMTVQNCPECNYPVKESDHALYYRGDLMHQACWRLVSSQTLMAASRGLIRRSRRLLHGLMQRRAFENTVDEQGWPTCPMCNTALQPAESAARHGQFMVHITCWKKPTKAI
jgi:hypothetical protein